ncbi:MMPL family transporter [Salinispora tropica]|uniref:MMPL domain protein n=1 Tax=Salinispora tropica (strain ATCC BAA-916 / DSM 44818 / JCM 13857 / NBRC 105044 / CNB-440) TaxID=369723 RepID=A4X4T7_SALTO|nr:MMPL family transporter [Salinispora tropica]ABP53887.1 MMPL domain protein [Salinispora tropica CNB-440]
MRNALYSYGRLAARRPWQLLTAWLLVAAAVVGVWVAVGTSIDDAITIPGSDSSRAQEIQNAVFPASALGNGTLVFHDADSSVTSPEGRAAIEASLLAVRDVDGVTQVVPPFPQEPGQPTPRISADGHTAYAQVYFDVPPAALSEQDADRVLAAASPATDAGLEVLPGGQLAQAAAGDPGHRSELIGLAVAAVVLLVALGAAAAMALPLVSALVGLVLGLAAIGLLSQVGAIPDIATTVASMISLGVGIDYALFIVVRYRTARQEGQPHERALGVAVATAGAAVLFAGATVAVGLGGLLLAGLPLLTSLGWTAAVAVGLSVVAAVGVLPAVLGVVGSRLDAGALPRRRSKRASKAGWWHRIGERTARRPWLAVVGSLLVLAVFIAPVADLELGQQDGGHDPVGTPTRQSYDLLESAFGPGVNGPLLVVADLGDTAQTDPATVQRQAAALSSALADVPGVQSVQGPRVSTDGSGALWQVVPTTAPSDPATGDLVTELREEILPPLATDGTQLHVGGQTAAKIDFTDQVAERLPLVLAVVIALSFLLLVVLFRSFVIPLTAALMNLLSVGAAYGILTFAFAEGHLTGLLGLDGPVPIESYIPLILFAILFGLSMDYEVFLVSSIAERWHAVRDNRRAVVTGLGSAGRVVTAAALIMFSVFVSFAGQDNPLIKMFGVGLGVAVLLDAVVVRGFLVPGIMVLLGRANWWFPRWLDRLMPRVDLEASPAADETPDGLPPTDGRVAVPAR